MAGRSLFERATVDFVQALSLGALNDLQIDIQTNPAIPEHEKRAAGARALEAVSRDILGNRAIADHVSTKLPKEVFARLSPIARAKFWAERERWAEADGVLHEAVQKASDPSIRGAYLVEHGRFWAARCEPDKAFNAFEAAYRNGVPLVELAHDILASPGVRDRFFELMSPRSQEVLFDAVFPSDPFAR